MIVGILVGRSDGLDSGTKVGLLDGDLLAVTVGSGVPLGVGLKEGDMEGTKVGIYDGIEEGEVLGIAEGITDGVVVGELEGDDDGTDVEGEELGNAVTSKSRHTSFTSQHKLQHLHTTSAGFSPSSSARQSEESS